MKDPRLTVTDSGPLSLEALERALPWCLTTVESPDAAIARRLVLTSTLTIGRAPGDGVTNVVDDPQLSRRHFSITNPSGAWLVEDHGSKNGTYVDGARVNGGARLAAGALIRAGGTFLLFEHDALQGPVSQPEDVLVGRSVAHLAVLDSVRTVGRTDIPVLLQGATGTGKELTAARIHAESKRPGELVAVNCAAIPASLAESFLFGHRRGAFTGATDNKDGCFRAAERGTLFLDEIGELPLDTQAKLLRVLESAEYTPVGTTASLRADVRIVAATNVDLRAAVAAGTFRMDLYARIAGFTIKLPALRERKADIPVLLRALIERFQPGWRGTIEPALLEALLLHDWPMNVRELVMVTRRLLLEHGDEPALRLVHLPRDLLQRPSADEDEAADREPLVPTRDALELLLKHFRGNVALVAKHLGKDRTQVYRWLKRHALNATDFR